MTEPALIDIPGGPEFLASCEAGIRDMSLFFVGAPDDVMTKALEQTRENLKVQLSESMGAEAGVPIADAFVAAVAGRRAEIERASRCLHGRHANG
jgi:hypothetical protein